jgi:hypothetical protein
VIRPDVLEELRAENPVPETLAPPPLEPLLARLDEEPRSDRRTQPKPSSRWRRAWALSPPLVAAAVAVAIVIGALALLRGAPKPTQATKPTEATKRTSDTLQHLVDILGVLRRPQTPVDRAFPAQLSGVQGAIMAGNAGTPVIRLARLATITSWGQKVFIAPMTPLTAAKATALEHRYPFLKSLFEQRQPQTLTLALFGNRATTFASPADIESGSESMFDGTNSILGLDGPGPPLRVVLVIPDGVAKVAFVLPRQAYPGAIVYPSPETIMVPVQNNIAAFKTDRYIDQDHWSMIGMTWYAPSGATVKRIGNFNQLNTVRPDPPPFRQGRNQNPAKWDELAMVPRTGSPSTTFTAAFRRPVTGAYRYVFRFSGPTPRTGCYSPVNQAVIRGPYLGIPSVSRGQIASTQFSSQTWCAGTYRVSVAPATRASQPFSTARFTVQP